MILARLLGVASPEIPGWLTGLATVVAGCVFFLWNAQSNHLFFCEVSNETDSG